MTDPDASPPPAAAPAGKRVFLVGATGSIGRATARALVGRGHEVVCFVRRRPGGRDGIGDGDGDGDSTGDAIAVAPDRAAAAFPGATVRVGDVTDPTSLARDGIRGERFDALVSCLASRTGVAADAWAIDHRANRLALEAARAAGATQALLLSAICVQKPRLEFQRAKLAFEATLMASGLDWTIVRPTAFFKSLSGQIERVRRGKPYLVFGDGRLTACKPIADADLAAFLADGLDDPARRNRILPIGGPGDAITPRQQGEALFALLGRPARFRSVSPALLDAVVAVLGAAARVVPGLAAKAELARIGRYYATESMLVLDPATGRYDAAATPSTGSATLFDFYARVWRGEARVERGDHAVF